MRILDENNKELTQEEADTEKGYLALDQILKTHHEAIEEQKRQFHYWPTCFYFEDGTFYKVSQDLNNPDPHVAANPDGVSFTFVPQTEDEQGKQWRGTDTIEIEDKPYIAPKEAWDEYEQIYRYKLYTEEELAEQKAAKEKQEKQDIFLATGPDRLTTSESDISDINVALAEIMGVA